MGGGWFVLDNANAMKIWPRNPGGRRRGGPYKRGTTVQYGFSGGIRPLAVSRFNTDLLKI